MNEQLDDVLDREHLKIASLRARSAAFAIDEILISILLFIVLWDSIAAAKTVEAIIGLTNHFLLEFMAIKIVYQTFFTMQYGATLGKIAMKIRVIEVKTLSNPSFFSAFNRAVFRVVSEALLYLGFVWALLDPYRRSWHDFTAKTMVVDA
ncbi:MAG: RDD family protein [Sulfuricurvum sp.]|nr:RDD family protein [Sulfuricurvum sp.]MDP3022823.1 RDD family protein [Sulfuricurvum sp.]